jgi:hypothetical protein
MYTLGGGFGDWSSFFQWLFGWFRGQFGSPV